MTNQLPTIPVNQDQPGADPANQPPDVFNIETPPTPEQTPNPNLVSPLPNQGPPTAQQAQATFDSTPPASQTTALPAIDQMQSHLSQSGKLLSELPVSTKPEANTSLLAALQPQNMVQTQQGPAPMYLPSQKEQPLVGTELASTYRPGSGSNPIEGLWLTVKKPLQNIVVLGLTGKSMMDIYEAGYFLVVTYPELEALLVSRQITQAQVNQVAIQASILLLSSIIGMVFAIRIFKSKAGIALNILVGIALFFGSWYVTQNLAGNIDLVGILGNPAQQIQSIQDVTTQGTQDLIENVDFLESNNNQPPDVVWFE